MAAVDFVLVGESVVASLPARLGEAVKSWSEKWFGGSASFSLCRYEEAGDWCSFRQLLTDDFSVYVQAGRSYGELSGLSRYLSDGADCETYAFYYLTRALCTFFSALTALSAFEVVGLATPDAGHRHFGAVVFSIDVGAATFLWVCKVPVVRKDIHCDSVKKTRLIENEEVTLCVGFDDTELPISEIFSIKPGDVIEMNHSVRNPLRMICNNVDIGGCTLGRLDGHLAVKVSERST